MHKNKVFKDKSDRKKIVKVLEKFCDEKLQPFINSSFQNLANYVNAFQQKMIMKREVIANKGIWTSKKRYILNVFKDLSIEYIHNELSYFDIPTNQ